RRRPAERRGWRICAAQRRSLARLRLAGAEPAVGVLDIEHREQAADAITLQTEFLRLGLDIVVVVVRRGADRDYLAHRGVGEIVVQPGCDLLRLRDSSDGSIG